METVITAKSASDQQRQAFLLKLDAIKDKLTLTKQSDGVDELATDSFLTLRAVIMENTFLVSH
jgi:hypothetical protein